MSPTVAHPDRLGGSAGCTAAAELPSVAHPLFAGPPGTEDGSPAGASATGGFAIFTPAAFAILRSSFSSRLRSFSLRLSTSSFVLRLARCVACMSRKRTLWWCAYEFVCSSYCATFWNCFSHTSQ